MLVSVSTRASFEAACSAARDVGAGSSDVRGLGAPTIAGVLGRVDEAWDAIESALRRAADWGADRSREAVGAAIATVEGLVADAGALAGDVQDALLDRLRVYVTKLVDGALASVRGSITVGGVGLVLEAVDVAQKVTIAGSMKASITEAWALTSSGELTVTARYAVASGR